MIQRKLVYKLSLESLVNSYNLAIGYYWFIYVHFCLPKNEPKRAPRCPDPSGCLALLAIDGTLKNSSDYSGLKQF